MDDVVVVVLLEQPTNKSAVDNAVIFNVEIKFISFPFLIIKYRIICVKIGYKQLSIMRFGNKREPERKAKVNRPENKP